ncbi:MAG: hybrid sensor histidine kinase/response regulator [bacterium]|nr:hybrid sensor histidine kinase/response regulator [bacterium]
MPYQERILIVDDNPTNIAILEETLDEEYQIETALSGEEALALAADFRPALILLDIMMPGIDGYETCQRIRSDPTLHNVKIIMVSAKAMVSERLEGYQAGADDYITKPFEEEELLAKVRVYLRLKSVEELDQMKSDMLSLLSHEVRTPLNSIIPTLEMLLSEENMNAEERRVWLETALQSAQRLLSLFDKALTLSMMRSGEYDFQLQPDDLCNVVRDAVCAVAKPVSARHVRIDQALPDAAPAMLDRAQMTAVVAAILDNAVRFSPTKGCVSIEIAHDDDCFCLTITDQGAGIDPDAQSHVFKEFTPADIMSHTEGQGLSLAIARQTVLAHNGTIDVESTKGAGTTFTVRLPSTL